MERLEKGFAVLYRMGINNFSSAEAIITAMKNEDGIEATKSEFDDRVVLIKGFVAGDTEEHGISVLSLDNNDICLCKAGPEEIEWGNKLRNLLKRGHYTQGETGLKSNPFASSYPECPYK